jgi:MerR family transcriptional regulator, copper efflux regulator
VDDDLVPIGEAARRCGLAPSALRYYDERGLVRPAARINGIRWYGRDELRRIVLIRAGQELGMGLDDIAEYIAAQLGTSGQDWRAIVRRHVTEVEAQIARLEHVKEFMEHALACPWEYPLKDCPELLGWLDRRIEPAERTPDA